MEKKYRNLKAKTPRETSPELHILRRETQKNLKGNKNGRKCSP